MGLLHRSLNDILRIDLKVDALDQLQWRDFGNGLSMSRLAREGKREMILVSNCRHRRCRRVSETRTHRR